MSFRSKTLRDLVEVGDQLQDPNLLIDVVQIFLEQAPLQIKELAEAYAKGDHEAIKFLAHKLKTSSSVVGSEKLQSVCLQIETAAPDNDPLIGGGIKRLEADVAAECALVEAELKAFLASRQN